jgi:hypothetical protein
VTYCFLPKGLNVATVPVNRFHSPLQLSFPPTLCFVCTEWLSISRINYTPVLSIYLPYYSVCLDHSSPFPPLPLPVLLTNAEKTSLQQVLSDLIVWVICSLSHDTLLTWVLITLYLKWLTTCLFLPIDCSINVGFYAHPCILRKQQKPQHKLGSYGIFAVLSKSTEVVCK